MNCYFHPEAESVATCVSCGKPVCQDCAVDVRGKIHCQPCLASTDRPGVGTLPTVPAASSVPTNTLAIVSVALGVVGLLGCVCGGGIGGLLFGIPATITGWVARKQILEAGSEQQGSELATVGLVLGIAEVILSILILVLVGSALGLSLLTEGLQ